MNDWQLIPSIDDDGVSDSWRFTVVKSVKVCLLTDVVCKHKIIIVNQSPANCVSEPCHEYVICVFQVVLEHKEPPTKGNFKTTEEA